MRLVKSTVHLVGLAPSMPPVWVSDDDEQIARWLRGGQLREATPEEAEGIQLPLIPDTDPVLQEVIHPGHTEPPVPEAKPRRRRAAS